MNRKSLIAVLLITLAGVACLLVYKGNTTADPEHYYRLGIEASYGRDIPAEVRNFKKAIRCCQKDLEQHLSLALASYDGLAAAYMHNEEYGKAEKVLLTALDMAVAHRGQHSAEAMKLYYLLALYASYAGESAKSVRYNKEVLRIAEELSPDEKRGPLGTGE